LKAPRNAVLSADLLRPQNTLVVSNFFYICWRCLDWKVTQK